MGYLHSRPKRGANDNAPVTRLEARKKSGGSLGLPEITAGGQLIDMMMRPDGIGWCHRDSEGGSHPIPWAEIMSFGAHHGLDAWERGTIRAMSSAYLDGLSIGTDPTGISPTAESSVDPADKQEMAAQIRSVFRFAAPDK